VYTEQMLTRICLIEMHCYVTVATAISYEQFS
jgi:hypothetical protein